jgi:hypothetical protein
MNGWMNEKSWSKLASCLHICAPQKIMQPSWEAINQGEKSVEAFSCLKAFDYYWFEKIHFISYSFARECCSRIMQNWISFRNLDLDTQYTIPNMRIDYLRPTVTRQHLKVKLLDSSRREFQNVKYWNSIWIIYILFQFTLLSALLKK